MGQQPSTLEEQTDVIFDKRDEVKISRSEKQIQENIDDVEKTTNVEVTPLFDMSEINSAIQQTSSEPPDSDLKSVSVNILNYDNKNNQVRESIISDPINEVEITRSIEARLTKIATARRGYIHPIIGILTNADNVSRTEEQKIDEIKIFIEPLQYEDSNGQIQNEFPEDIDLLKPYIEQGLSFACETGENKVIEYILKTYPLLDVSTDDNFCFKAANIKGDIQSMLVLTKHESFVPEIDVMNIMIDKGNPTMILNALESPHCCEDIRTIKTQLNDAAMTGRFNTVRELLDSIKQKRKSNSPIKEKIIRPDSDLANHQFIAPKNDSIPLDYVAQSSIPPGYVARASTPPGYVARASTFDEIDHAHAKIAQAQMIIEQAQLIIDKAHKTINQVNQDVVPKVVIDMPEKSINNL